ncbi:hypothetical protein [Paenisporosarcina sp.]|uniref:hypothetical protein n=1 Tax=Paenisporosarcina sp. TaxID=1932001 RepID=UPI003C75B8AB
MNKNHQSKQYDLLLKDWKSIFVNLVTEMKVISEAVRFACLNQWLSGDERNG